MDIFQTLGAIDQHDMEYLKNHEHGKGFAPPVVLRWASSCDRNTEYWLRSINLRANVHHYAIYAHPDLQYRLMASCGLGNRERHNWIPNKRDNNSAKQTEFILRYWPDANALEQGIIIRELKDAKTLHEFLLTTGLQDDEIKRIKKLF